MDFVVQNLPKLLDGARITLAVAVQAGLIALAISLVFGVLRTLGNRTVDLLTGAYVEFFRGTSAFVQIFWAYFALPMLGLRLEAMTAGILVLALNAGAYGTEIVRGALCALPRGQKEAAVALGLPVAIIYLRVLLPQALMRAVLPFGNLLIDLLKGTSLLSAITVTELAFAGRQIVSAQGHTMTVFGLVLLIYLVMALPIAMLARWLDRSLARWRVGSGKE